MEPGEEIWAMRPEEIRTSAMKGGVEGSPVTMVGERKRMSGAGAGTLAGVAAGTDMAINWGSR